MRVSVCPESTNTCNELQVRVQMPIVWASITRNTTEQEKNRDAYGHFQTFTGSKGQTTNAIHSSTLPSHFNRIVHKMQYEQ